MKKQTTLTARACISEAAEALGMGDSEKINKCVDHLCEKFYIPGLMAEAIQSLVWQVGYEARKEWDPPTVNPVQVKAFCGDEEPTDA